MYIPVDFEVKEKNNIFEFINQYAFATLITTVNEVPFASHIPLLIENKEDFIISGHLARANEQWHHFKDDKQVLVIFQGPHTYISPSNYENAGVPTWNYTAVHLYGVVSLIENERRLIQIIESLTDKYEKSKLLPWIAEYSEKMLRAIIGFEITVTRIEAKFKLSQNRSEKDRLNIISNLSSSGDSDAIAVADLMSENESKKVND